MKTYYQSNAALGTHVHMAIVTAKDEAWAQDLLRRFWLEILLFEKCCSRFVQSSELSQFNRSAGMRSIVTPEFRSVLLAARRMAQETNGLYNPFVLPALQRAGYTQSMVPEYADDRVDDHSTKRIVSAEALDIGDNWAGIPYGTAIDLGGCGKGFIGDVLAGMADAQEGLTGYWFSIGGDVVTGGSDEQGKTWTVSITPHIADISERARIGTAAAPSDGRFAVATSTVQYRKSEAEGRQWHHIIDPRTGKPADTVIRLASVCSGSLLQADVFASCAIIIGYPECVSWLKKQAPLGAMVQVNDDSGKGAPGLVTKTIGHGIKKWL